MYNTDYTLKKLCSDYLERYKKPFIKPGTYERYRECLLHLPSIELDCICADTLQDIINEMLELNLSSSSIKQVAILYKQAVREAQRRRQIPPFELYAHIPKTPHKAVRAFSRSEQEILLANRDKTFYGDFFCALMYSGCRAGKLIGLEWRDIDFNSHTFEITRTDSHGNVGTPKTHDSERRLPISDELMEIFRRCGHKSIGGRVFRNTLGTKISYRAVLDAWHRYLDCIGIKTCGLHVLRHTYATNALKAGVNYEVLSKLLGHGSVSVTMDIYCDITDDDKKTAADMLSRFYTQANEIHRVSYQDTNKCLFWYLLVLMWRKLRREYPRY